MKHKIKTVKTHGVRNHTVKKDIGDFPRLAYIINLQEAFRIEEEDTKLIHKNLGLCW
jgi:hypothetical protein